MKAKIKIIKNKKTIAAFFLMAGILVVSGCGLKQPNPKRYTINLEVWGLFDDQDAFNKIIDTYKKLDPNIGDITYKKMSPDTYKQDLLDALASGNGPDIFLIQNHWLPGFQDKISPAPPLYLNEQTYRNEFVDVAAQDFISQGQVYAVPLTVNSLALYYNKDLFNAAGITGPPANWDEFVSDAKKLTVIGGDGQIAQSGAALGTTANINRPTDILNLLMLQGGTQMTDPTTGRATFDQVTKLSDGSSSAPGQNALNFYTQFANRNSSFYSWNPSMHYSIDAFAEGNLAMMFNYSWQEPVIESKAPKLNYGVAPVPQFAGSAPVNFPNYWAFAVAKNKTPDTHQMNPSQAAIVTNDVRVAEAWRFLTYLTTKPQQNQTVSTGVTGSGQTANLNFDPAADYLTKTSQPAARRDLIDRQKTDPNLGVFAEGNLIDKDWTQSDPDAIENIFINMINQVDSGQSGIQDAIQSAAASVSQISMR